MSAPELVNIPKPTVIFRNNPSINEAASAKANRPIYDDMEVCDIFFPANKTSQPCCRALDQADFVDDPITQMRRPRTYMEKYATEYQAFKAGNAQAMSGTPLEEATFLTEGKRLELKHGLKIYTIEQLASLDGLALKNLGSGGRDLVDRAKAYLDAALKGADEHHLRDELAKRDAEMAEMREQIKALMAAQSGTAPTGTQEGALAPTNSAPAPQITEDPKWATYADIDISNMLKEAGQKVDGRWGREKLIAEAEALIASRQKAA